jgi:rare lipoprotein A
MAGRIARPGLLFGLLALGLAACASVGPGSGPYVGGGVGRHGTDKPYQIDGRWYYPHAQPDYDEVGAASWYGEPFHNRHTADGEIFDQYALSAAHKTLPLPSIVEVTNLDNGKRLRLRVNDRGPFVGDRIIDVSRAAADALGFRGQGLARVRVRYIGPAPPLAAVTYARATPAPSMATPPAPEPEPDADPEVEPPRPIAPVRTRALAQATEPDDAAPSPPTPPADLVAAPVAPSPGGFAVQAAAFASRDNARRAAGRLGAVGAATIRTVTTADGLTLYRVVLTGFPDADAARVARGQVIAAGYGDAQVIAPF